MGDGLTISDIGSPSSLAMLFITLVWIIRTWPHWKAKINEARKIQLDADGERLAQAFARIRLLEEAQSADRREFHKAMSDERHRCDEELEELRRGQAELRKENEGLQAMIRQNSQSTAQMMGRPDAVAAITARKNRKDDE